MGSCLMLLGLTVCSNEVSCVYLSVSQLSAVHSNGFLVKLVSFSTGFLSTDRHPIQGGWAGEGGGGGVTILLVAPC